MQTIEWSDFDKIALHVGTITSAKLNPKAHKAAYILEIDFGLLGTKRSSAQLTVLYTEADLIGKQIVAVLNFAPKLIAGIKSECLVLGSIGLNNDITLLHPGFRTENGLRIG